MFDNLIIVAGGLGTRLQEYTFNNKIPKLLTNLGQYTVFDCMMKHHIANAVYVVCNSQHSNIIKNIIKYHKYNAYVIEYDDADGTASTVCNIIKNNHIHGNTAIVWSDIVCESTMSLQPLLKMAYNKHLSIGLDKNATHRFKFEDGKVIADEFENGKVCGIYAIKNAQTFIKNVFKQNLDKHFHRKFDLVELFNLVGMHINATEIDSIIDIGESYRYKQYMQNVTNVQRYFNDIDLSGELVVKSANCEKGESIMKDEIEAYKFLYNVDSSLVPYLYTAIDNKSIMLEKLNCTLDAAIVKNNYSINYCKELYSRYKSAIKLLHNVGNDERIGDAYKQEYYKTTLNRYESIKDVYNIAEQFANLNFYSIIERIKNFLDDYTPIVGAIHGDPHTSNIMFDNNNNLKFIDPRGYFGNVKIYGDIRYDNAKFIYGLMCGSRLNQSTNFVTADFDKIAKTAYDILDEVDEDDTTKLITAIVWLKAPQYIINAPAKSVAAGIIGLTIADKYLTKLGY